MTLNVFVGGEVFSIQPYGGVSRIFNEVLPRVCDFDTSVTITLLAEKPFIAKSIPRHDRIFYVKWPPVDTYKPRRLWRYIASPIKNGYLHRFSMGSNSKTIWHSTYYRPMPGWKGPQLLTVYDLTYEKWPSWFADSAILLKQKSQFIQTADRVICISECVRQDLLNFYSINAEKTQVIRLSHSGIFSPRTQFLASKVDFPFILYVGGRHRYKGFFDLLEAFSRWKYKNEIFLLVVGSEWLTEEKERIHQLDLDKHIYLYTNTSDEILCDLYNQALAFIYPSYYEGFGIPLLEAMACACPLVASKIPTSLEVADTIPFYFTCGELDGLIDALDQAIQTAKSSIRIEQGLVRTQRYSWDKTARETLELYRTLMK